LTLGPSSAPVIFVGSFFKVNIYYIISDMFGKHIYLPGGVSLGLLIGTCSTRPQYIEWRPKRIELYLAVVLWRYSLIGQDFQVSQSGPNPYADGVTPDMLESTIYFNTLR
jgi:hypothetical protein